MVSHEASRRRFFSGFFRIAPWILGTSLFFSLAIFVAGTWHWPLVGDASLYHYVAFLMDHGFAPYRQIVEINMPGCYLVHWLVLHTLGGGALNWRIFDLLVMGATGAAMIAITLPYGVKAPGWRVPGWFLGFAGAGLLTLIHGQDGVAFLGERDQVMAALLAISFCFFFLGLRHNRIWMFLPAAIAAGAAATIKPWAAPAGAVLLVLVAFRLKSLGRPVLRPLLSSVAGFLLPGAVVCGYLLRMRALGAFFATMLGPALYYNAMYRRPLSYLLAHSIAPLGPLVAVWLIVIVAGRRRWNWEEWMLAGGVLFGLISYCAQGRGFQYHRYPLLMFLLTLMSIDFAEALERPGLRFFAAAAAAYALLVLAPQCAFKARRYDWRNQEFITMLSGDLQNLGGAKLSGKVQCLDTTAGCINTLYRDRLVQATGYIYDCYAYAPRGNERMDVVNDYRKGFFAAIEQNLPEVFVVSNQYCQGGGDGYAKLDRWPAIQTLLDGQYRLYAERMPPDDVYWWSRVLKPSGYRIYVRK
ncbi:MAG TPA: hypothetical protein VHX11_08445 [Acidobacteriaceae bacterium]|nr:hypothetical protein [Acidobacteriaceae bacterium]